MAPLAAGRPRSPRPTRLAALLAVLVLALSACGGLIGTEPPATPTDFPGLAGRMKLAGVVLDDWVSGDAGCADPNLVPASISFNATGLDQATPVKIYLYVFRNKDAWERHRDAIGPCAQSWVTDAQTYEEIQESPYVIAGQGPWAPGFEAAVRSALATAAGTGG
jgi:hypothetical protein